MRAVIAFCIFILSWPVLAAQNAKVIGPQVEIYSDGNFDSEIIDYVNGGEVYQISDRTYGGPGNSAGPFYRIRLKDGTVGYIVDYQLDIEGKGRVVPKDLDQVLLDEQKKNLEREKNNPRPKTLAEEEEAIFGRDYAGFTAQLINYHENTMGGEQIADLVALGYKSISQLSWSVIGSYGAPKYYAEKTGGSARGVKLWGDVGFSSALANFQSGEVRAGAGIFTHISLLTIDTPARKYDLHDITAGVLLEGSLLWKINRNKNAIDFAVRYYFDKSSYAGFGLSFLF